MPKNEEQGTGKHPHKSSEEPFPHHESKQADQSQSRGNKGQERSGGEQSQDSDDLKSREYTDAQGNVHHHTRTYEEQHKQK